MFSNTPACDAGTCVIPQFHSNVVEAVQSTPLPASANHAFTAAERPVVNGPMQVVRPVPQIVDLQFERAEFGRARHNAVLERPFKKCRKNSEQVELHAF